MKIGNNRYLRWGITLFLVIAASLLFYYTLFHLENIKNMMSKLMSILMPIIYGFILAYILSPILNGIEQRMIYPLLNKLKHKVGVKTKKIVRALSVFLTTAIMITTIYGFFAIVIPSLASSIEDIVHKSDEYWENLVTWVEQILEDNPDLEALALKYLDQYSEELDQFINDTILPSVNTIIKSLSLSLVNMLTGVWNFFIGIVISLYLLTSKELFGARCKKVVFGILKPSIANRLLANVRFTHKTFGGFIGGKIVDSIIIGILCFIGTSILGIPYAALVSLIIGVTNIIPFFGPFIGAIPTALLILMVDPIKCLYFVIFIIVLQQLDGNVIGPKILGDSTGLSAFWVIFSITVFGGLFGVIGMFIGVPVFAILFAWFKTFIEKRLARKGLPKGTMKYLQVLYIKSHDLLGYDHEMIERSHNKSNKQDKNKKNGHQKYSKSIVTLPSTEDELMEQESKADDENDDTTSK